MSRQIVSVVGGTGLQGGGVVEALLEREQFDVRVLTRNPDSEKAKSLAERGVEIVRADLNAPETLPSAFAGSHGAFVVTNFWDPDTGSNEYEQGKAATIAAKEAGVEHYVWSTLPNSKAISRGKLAVNHFTGKAQVDSEVIDAGFKYHTFVEAPFYFQNLVGFLKPRPIDGRGMGWAVPMDPARRCIHVGDVADVGKVVARIFEEPDQVGRGQRLAVASAMPSWEELVETLNAQGHDFSVVQVPTKVYDKFFPGAIEIREMSQWFEKYTYFGPDAQEKLEFTSKFYQERFNTFADWASENMQA